jgi:hypothetical protein
MMCGNAVIEGDELCDGDNLGGADCVSLGYVGGELTCNDQCAYDISACLTCGDGILDPGEDCDGAAIESTCVDLGFTGGEISCTAECAFDTSACSNIPFPLVGEVFITEIMQNPFTLADADSEWFEIFNPSLGATYQLGGCLVDGPTDTGFTIDGDLQIGPGEYVVLSIDSALDQGFVADFQWLDADFNLSNSTDAVTLICGGNTIDTVAYDDGATFPDPNGASMSLDPPNYGAALNDMGTSWCEGSTSYNGDFGTPGAANPPCPVEMNFTIDFCRLQFPTIVATNSGTSVDVFGRVFIAGLTDLSGLNDPAAQVIGYVGYGPDGSDPAVDAGWTWTAGVPNAGYSPASPNYEANNDEYTASFSAPPAGAYDFAFRFSGDGGATFTYCDGGDAGSSNGYAPADAGQLTVAAAPTPFFSEYLEGASNDKALELYNPGTDPFALAGCTIKFYPNGNTAANTTIMLTGSIPADDVYVVCDDSSNATILGLCDQTSNAASFYNGNDAVEFACGTTTLDVIGQIGFDPGAEWLVNGVGTQNEDIRRSCSVTTGDPDGSNVFDPSLEWTTHLQSDFTDLGQYVCP